MISTQTLQSSLSNILSAFFVRTSTATKQQAAATAKSRKRKPLAISLRQVATPTSAVAMTVCGKVNSRSYRSLVEKCEQLHDGGVDRLVVDLNEMPTLELTGLFALHCIAKVFRNQGYAGPENGGHGLRRIAEENLNAGLHSHVKLLVNDETVAAKLKQAGIDQVFTIHRTEAGALQSF